jgi:hypothetical protein
MNTRRKGLFVFILAGLALSVAMALIVSPWASSSPDGLEKVAEDKGFIEKAEETEPVWSEAPIADYAVPGMIGTVAIFLLAWGLALVLRSRKRDDAGEQPSSLPTT